VARRPGAGGVKTGPVGIGPLRPDDRCSGVPAMTHRPIALLLAPLLGAMLAGCASGPSLHYRVDFAHRDSRGVPVTVEITDAPRDSLVLEGYLQTSLMRLSDVAAVTATGRALTAIMTSSALAGGGDAETEFPAVRLD